jgi:hypothetical protein
MPKEISNRLPLRPSAAAHPYLNVARPPGMPSGASAPANLPPQYHPAPAARVTHPASGAGPAAVSSGAPSLPHTIKLMMLNSELVLTGARYKVSAENMRLMVSASGETASQWSEQECAFKLYHQTDASRPESGVLKLTVSHGKDLHEKFCAYKACRRNFDLLQAQSRAIKAEIEQAFPMEPDKLKKMHPLWDETCGVFILSDPGTGEPGFSAQGEQGKNLYDKFVKYARNAGAERQRKDAMNEINRATEEMRGITGGIPAHELEADWDAQSKTFALKQRTDQGSTTVFTRHNALGKILHTLFLASQEDFGRPAVSSDVPRASNEESATVGSAANAATAATSSGTSVENPNGQNEVFASQLKEAVLAQLIADADQPLTHPQVAAKRDEVERDMAWVRVPNVQEPVAYPTSPLNSSSHSSLDRQVLKLCEALWVNGLPAETVRGAMNRNGRLGFSVLPASTSHTAIRQVLEQVPIQELLLLMRQHMPSLGNPENDSGIPEEEKAQFESALMQRYSERKQQPLQHKTIVKLKQFLDMLTGDQWSKNKNPAGGSYSIRPGGPASVNRNAGASSSSNAVARVYRQEQNEELVHALKEEVLARATAGQPLTAEQMAEKREEISRYLSWLTVPKVAEPSNGYPASPRAPRASRALQTTRLPSPLTRQIRKVCEAQWLASLPAESLENAKVVNGRLNFGSIPNNTGQSAIRQLLDRVDIADLLILMGNHMPSLGNPDGNSFIPERERDAFKAALKQLYAERNQNEGRARAGVLSDEALGRLRPLFNTLTGDQWDPRLSMTGGSGLQEDSASSTDDEDEEMPLPQETPDLPTRSGIPAAAPSQARAVAGRSVPSAFNAINFSADASSPSPALLLTLNNLHAQLSLTAARHGVSGETMKNVRENILHMVPEWNERSRTFGLYHQPGTGQAARRMLLTIPEGKELYEQFRNCQRYARDSNDLKTAAMALKRLVETQIPVDPAKLPEMIPTWDKQTAVFTLRDPSANMQACFQLSGPERLYQNFLRYQLNAHLEKDNREIEQKLEQARAGMAQCLQRFPIQALSAQWDGNSKTFILRDESQPDSEALFHCNGDLAEIMHAEFLARQLQPA